MSDASEHQKVEEFRGWLHRFEGLWRSLVVRVGWTRLDEVDLAVHLHASLEPEEPAAIARPVYMPQVDGYKTAFHVLPAASVGELLAGLVSGNLTLEEQAFVPGNRDQPSRMRSDFVARDANHWLVTASRAEAFLHDAGATLWVRKNTGCSSSLGMAS